MFRDVARMFVRVSVTGGMAAFCGLIGGVIGVGMAAFADEVSRGRAPLPLRLFLASGMFVAPLLGAACGAWLGWQTWRPPSE